MPQEKIIVVSFPDLFRAVREFVQEALGALQKIVGDPPKWPVSTFQEVRFVEQEGGTRAEMNWRERQNPPRALNEAWDELVTLQSYRNSLKVLGALEKEGKAVGHTFLDLGRSYLLPIIDNYLSATGSLSLNDEVLLRAYEYVEKYLYTDFISTRVFLELGGLGASIPQIELSPTHRLVRLDENYARAIWNVAQSAHIPVTAYIPFQQRMYWPLPGEVVLEATLKYQKTKARELGVLLASETNRSAFALRLCHPGSGRVDFVTYEHLGFTPESGRFGFRQEILPGRFSYSLDESVGSNMKAMWPASYSLASDLETKPDAVQLPLRVAARRFSASFEKRNDEDRLLDYMIAIEGLYGKEDRDISYRIPLRLAMTLGDTPDERQEIFALTRAAYTQRSNLAHGTELLGGTIKVRDKIPLGDFLLRVQSCLIESIHLFLRTHRRGMKKDALLNLIDSAIITQDRTPLKTATGP